MEDEEEGEEAEKEDTSGPDYNYLLSMPMWFLTKEKKEELCKQRDAKVWCSAMLLELRFLNWNWPISCKPDRTAVL